MDRQVVEDIQLSVDTASLYKREHGPIWGRVCLSIGNRFFPDAAWTDIAVAFCVCWLHALRQLASKETTAGTVFFFDGPFRADINLSSADAVDLVLVDCHDPEKITYRSEQKIGALLSNALITGQVILNTATEQNWSNDQDVQALRGEVDAAETLLSDGC